MVDVAIQMLHNELLKCERALDSKKRAVDILLKKKTKGSVRNEQKPRIYSTEYEFDPGDLTSQVKSFVVDYGTIFRPADIENSLRVTGFTDAMNTPDSLATLTIPFGDIQSQTGRNGFFEFYYQIRDSGSDREWQNHPQPSPFMMSGLLQGLGFGKRAVLAPGSEVFIEIRPILSKVLSDPTFSDTPGPFEGDVTKYTLHVSMHGHEEFIK